MKLRFLPVIWWMVLGTTEVGSEQVTVTELGVGSESIESTAAIRVQHADFTVTEGLADGAVLKVGELLTGLEEDLFLELSCPAGSKLHFTGTFQVLVNPPLEGVDCAVELRTGKLDVLTEGRTEVESGEVTLGSEGTRYAVRVGSEHEKLERVLVFEGEVEVKTPEVTERVMRGQALNFGSPGSRPHQVAVTDAEIDRWANLYARFNTIQAKDVGAEPDVAKLVRLHRRVLRRPDDRLARIELAELQASYRIWEERYQRRRLEEANSTSLDSAPACLDSEDDLCDPGLRSFAGDRGYRPRPLRCEGLFVQGVSRLPLVIASFTMERISASKQPSSEMLSLQWVAPPGLDSVRLRAQALVPGIPYRMDAKCLADAVSFEWPTDLLESLGLDSSQVGVVAWSELPAGRRVYLPLVFSSGNSIDASRDRRLLLTILAKEESEILLRLSALDSHGSPAEPFHEGLVKASITSAGSAYIIELPDLPTGDLYYLQLETVVHDESTLLELFFYFPGEP